MGTGGHSHVGGEDREAQLVNYQDEAGRLLASPKLGPFKKIQRAELKMP